MQMNDQDEEEFQFILKQVFKFEGGYVNDPDDHGGQTNMGITQQTYESFHAQAHDQIFYDLPKAVQQLTKYQAKKFYLWYYKGSQAQKIKNLYSRLIYFDSYVLFGVTSRFKILKKAVQSDAKETSIFIEILNQMDQKDFQKKYLDAREQIHIENSKAQGQQKFLKGWINRVNELRKICQVV